MICDLEMPDIDGIELINLLSARHIRSGLIIASGRERALLSAVELMATTEGLYVLGALQKPVAEDALSPAEQEALDAALPDLKARLNAL